MMPLQSVQHQSSGSSQPELVKLRKIERVSSPTPETMSRPSALGPSGRNYHRMTGKEAGPGPGASVVDRAEACVRADQHASEMEFESTRLEIEELVQRSMSAAEAGVRLPHPVRGRATRLAPGHIGKKLLSDHLLTTRHFQWRGVPALPTA